MYLPLLLVGRGSRRRGLGESTPLRVPRWLLHPLRHVRMQLACHVCMCVCMYACKYIVYMYSGSMLFLYEVWFLERCTFIVKHTIPCMLEVNMPCIYVVCMCGKHAMYVWNHFTMSIPFSTCVLRAYSDSSSSRTATRKQKQPLNQYLLINV